MQKYNYIKAISLVVIAVLISIVVFTLILKNDSYIAGLSFPRDEGRHNGVNEGWYAFFHLNSTDGDRYSYNMLYYISNSSDILFKQAALTDISDKIYYNQKAQYPSQSYTVDTENLDFNITMGGNLDRWYQIGEKLFVYNFSVGFSSKGKEIFLECHMESNKNPISTNQKTMGVLGESFDDTYYYAQTNIGVSGRLRIGDIVKNVSGIAWIEHYWGGQLVTTWNYFPIQLYNDYEIVAVKVFEGEETSTYALIVDPDGNTREMADDLKINDVEFTQLGFVKKSYLVSETEKINLTIAITVENQVFLNSGGYKVFEGSYDVVGEWNSKPVQGVAFSEQIKE